MTWKGSQRHLKHHKQILCYLNLITKTKKYDCKNVRLAANIFYPIRFEGLVTLLAYLCGKFNLTALCEIGRLTLGFKKEAWTNLRHNEYTVCRCNFPLFGVDKPAIYRPAHKLTLSQSTFTVITHFKCIYYQSFFHYIKKDYFEVKIFF